MHYGNSPKAFVSRLCTPNLNVKQSLHAIPKWRPGSMVWLGWAFPWEPLHGPARVRLLTSLHPPLCTASPKLLLPLDPVVFVRETEGNAPEELRPIEVHVELIPKWTKGISILQNKESCSFTTAHGELAVCKPTGFLTGSLALEQEWKKSGGTGEVCSQSSARERHTYQRVDCSLVGSPPNNWLGWSTC